MKKIIGAMSICLGICCMYLGVLAFLDINSTNQADKSRTFVGKVQAKLNFYYDEKGAHELGNTKQIRNGKDFFLYDQWSSKNYPISDEYKKLRVRYGNEPTITPDAIKTKVNVVTRYSH